MRASEQDDLDFAEICSALGATPAGEDRLGRFGVTAEVLPEEDGGPAPTTLSEISTLVGDCRRCGLCAGRKNLVHWSGPERAELMVVGEAPGREEDEQGTPFVGPAGAMLDRMLENVLRLPRSEVHVANAVRCRPPKNRDPEPAEVAACAPFLAQQRGVVRPRAVLLLGSVALRACAGVETGVRAARGRWYSWGDVPAIATFHPAYLLREPGEKRRVLEDLLLLREFLTSALAG